MITHDNLKFQENMRYHEPHHEKTRFFAYPKTKAQISCAVTAQLISTSVFAIHGQYNNYSSSFEAAQAGLCQTWSETLCTDFLASQFNIVTRGIDPGFYNTQPQSPRESGQLQIF